MSKKLKIAVLGGSFNPIHIGHLALADEVCTSLHYDKVIFVPSLNSPHKEMNCALLPSERLKMVRLSCKGDSRFLVEDCEILRGGVSYTYQTLEFLEKKYKNLLSEKLGLILGSDLFSGFHLWKNAQEISEKATLILARRPLETQEFENQHIVSPDSQLNSQNFATNQQLNQQEVQSQNHQNHLKLHQNKALGEYAKLAEQKNSDFDVKNEVLFKNAIFLENPLIPVSSTEIRTRISEGKAFKYLVENKVFKYIKKKGFYDSRK